MAFARLATVIVALALPTFADAAVFKCKTSKGFVYQGTPCVEGEQSKPTLIDSTMDLSGARAYGDQVKQREAVEEQQRKLGQAQDDLRVAQYERQQAEKKAREEGDRLRKGADHCNVTVVGGHKHEQCVYGNGANASYVYIDDGIPKGFQYTK